MAVSRFSMVWDCLMMPYMAVTEDTLENEDGSVYIERGRNFTR